MPSKLSDRTGIGPKVGIASPQVMCLIDAAVWLVGIWLMVGIVSLGGGFPPWQDCLILSIAGPLLQVLFGLLLGAYMPGRFGGKKTDGKWAFIAGFLDAAVLILMILAVKGSLESAILMVPLSALLALSGMYTYRAILGLDGSKTGQGMEGNALDLSHLSTKQMDTREVANQVPIIVYGTGYVGTRLVDRLTTDPLSPYQVVGMVDDDPDKLGFEIRGCKVMGTIDDAAKIAAQTGAQVLAIAMAQPSREVMQSAGRQATLAHMEMKIPASVTEIFDRSHTSIDLRTASIEDLLGRDPVTLDLEAIGEFLWGKRVLITGAGGSIGSELCIQVARFHPAELMLLDRDETALQSVQLRLSGNGLLQSDETILADIRDAQRIEEIFKDRKPEIVFHAAALKHLPLLEAHPGEAWKSNVIGTLNVLEAASKVGVQAFVNISTDKAADPTSVLGYSKALAERLTAWAGSKSSGRYISVRFGNVIGSRGSMLPTFVYLIEHGLPLTVTHPDATRYFMTIPEACQLVLEAGVLGNTGGVMILDMGEPVRILDVANRMIEMSGKQISIEFTGLRPGEKLHEVLVSETQNDSAPRPHPKITQASIEPIDPADLDPKTLKQY